MRYIAIKPFQRKNVLGNFDIPEGATLDCKNGKLYYNGQFVCLDSACVMREYFSLNDDGCGYMRRRFVSAIFQSIRQNHDSGEMWQRIEEDGVCHKYLKRTQCDFWLWSVDFYRAPLDDLRHIAMLVGSNVEKER